MSLLNLLLGEREDLLVLYANNQEEAFKLLKTDFLIQKYYKGIEVRYVRINKGKKYNGKLRMYF